MRKSKLSISSTSLNSISPRQSSINSEIKELTKKLHFKDQELEKAYGMASDDVSIQATREQILYALKAVESAKQHLTDKTQEFCNKLNDYGICVTYSFASYKRDGKDILEFVSPYLLKNASDIEYIKAYIPEGYIKESNKNDAMELLGKREVRDYLEVKSTELASKSPVPSTPSTTDTFNYDSDEIPVVGEEQTAPNTEQA